MVPAALAEPAARAVLHARVFKPLRGGRACPDEVADRPGARASGPGQDVRSHEGREGERAWTSRNTPIGPRASCSRRRAWRCARGTSASCPSTCLKVLLDDPEGMAANLIQTAGGNAKAAQQAVEELLKKQPKVEGGGAGQLYMAPETARLFDQAAAGRQEGRRQLRHRRAAAAGAGDERHRRRQGADGRRHRAQGAEQRHQRDAQGPHGAEPRVPRKATTRSRSTRAT